jgi:hypothetical protein
MRKAILGAASALALASPAVAADLPITPYSQAPSYQEEPQAYEYRTPPPVVVEEPPVVVRRPVIVAPPVVVDEYPVYAAPPMYAYAGPVWRPGWAYRRHFYGGW